jgi:hypothetical protein
MFPYRAGSQSDCGAENLLCSTVGVGLKSPYCISSTTSGLSPIGGSTGVVIFSAEGTSVVAGVKGKVGWLGGIGWLGGVGWLDGVGCGSPIT